MFVMCKKFDRTRIGVYVCDVDNLWSTCGQSVVNLRSICGQSAIGQKSLIQIEKKLAKIGLFWQAKKRCQHR